MSCTLQPRGALVRLEGEPGSVVETRNPGARVRDC